MVECTPAANKTDHQLVYYAHEYENAISLFFFFSPWQLAHDRSARCRLPAGRIHVAQHAAQHPPRMPTRPILLVCGVPVHASARALRPTPLPPRLPLPAQPGRLRLHAPLVQPSPSPPWPRFEQGRGLVVGRPPPQ